MWEVAALISSLPDQKSSRYRFKASLHLKRFCSRFLLRLKLKEPLRWRKVALCVTSFAHNLLGERGIHGFLLFRLCKCRFSTHGMTTGFTPSWSTHHLGSPEPTFNLICVCLKLPPRLFHSGNLDRTISEALSATFLSASLLSAPYCVAKKCFLLQNVFACPSISKPVYSVSFPASPGFYPPCVRRAFSLMS